MRGSIASTEISKRSNKHIHRHLKREKSDDKLYASSSIANTFRSRGGFRVACVCVCVCVCKYIIYTHTTHTYRRVLCFRSV